MSADRTEKLRRLFAEPIPFPDGGRGFLVNTGLAFLARDVLAALGEDRVRAVERDLTAARALAAACPGLQVVHAPRAEPRAGDFVLMPVDKSRRRLSEDLGMMADRVGESGAVAVYGRRKEGIGPAVDFLDGFCDLDPPRSRGGMRLVIARPRATAPTPEAGGHYIAEARGQRVKVARKPGVFSWDALDPATALLLERCMPREGDHLLDLGCGAGVVAAVLLASGEVAAATLTDSDALALETATETLALGGFEAQVLASDAGEELPDKHYDLILCNPPFHKGFQTDLDGLERMIARAARLLAPRGRFYVVGPPTLALPARLEERFRRVDTLAGLPAVGLWRAGRPRRPDPDSRH